jgi:hypothetical protein
MPDNLERKKAWLKAAIPSDAIFLGTIEDTVMSGMLWNIEEDFYLIPLNEDNLDWALFRLYWEDGEETWEWSFDARLKGLKDQPLDAARLMITSLWEAMGIELEDPDEEFRKEFIENLDLLNKLN